MWAAAVRVLGECGFEPVTPGYSLLLISLLPTRRTSREVRRVGNKLIHTFRWGKIRGDEVQVEKLLIVIFI